MPQAIISENSKGATMNEIQILLLGAAQGFGVILFFYVLYLLGGMAQDLKKLLKKVEEMEKRLEGGVVSGQG